MPRHLEGAKKWHALFNTLKLPHPEGSLPPLNATHLPKMLAPLHTGLGSARKVLLKMVEDDNDGEDNYYAGRTVFVYTSESTATERRKMVDQNR